MKRVALATPSQRDATFTYKANGESWTATVPAGGSVELSDEHADKMLRSQDADGQPRFIEAIP